MKLVVWTPLIKVFSRATSHWWWLAESSVLIVNWSLIGLCQSVDQYVDQSGYVPSDGNERIGTFQA